MMTRLMDDVRGDGRGRREGQEPAQGHASCAEFEEREAELLTVGARRHDVEDFKKSQSSVRPRAGPRRLFRRAS